MTDPSLGIFFKRRQDSQSMKKYVTSANEELRGEEADLEIADISTDSAGSRFAMDTNQPFQGRLH